MIDVSSTIKLIRARARQHEHTTTTDDVLERSAFLEFCEGLDRPSADRQALKEFGFENWDALAPVGSPASSSASALVSVNA